MSVEWYYTITEDGQVVEIGGLERQAQRIIGAAEQAGQALAAWVESLVPALAEMGAAIIEAWRPLAEAVAEAVYSWWRSLPPWTRAWLRRRHAYGGRPVVGPPRRALFVMRRP
jgi:hypothetical protein